MTTTVLIVNKGPKSVNLKAGQRGTVIVKPGHFHEWYIYQDNPITIEEVQPPKEK